MPIAWRFQWRCRTHATAPDSMSRGGNSLRKAQGAGLKPQAQGVMFFLRFKYTEAYSSIVTAIINLDKLGEEYQQVLQKFSSMLPPPRFIQIVLPFKMVLIRCSQAPEHREVQTTGNISRPAASVEWFVFARTDALPGYCNLPVKLKHTVRPQIPQLHLYTPKPPPWRPKTTKLLLFSSSSKSFTSVSSHVFPHHTPIRRKRKVRHDFPKHLPNPAEHPPTVCK